MKQGELGDQISWRIATEVWWAQTWRWSLVTAVAGAAALIILWLFPQESKFTRHLLSLVMNLIIIVAAIWATKCSLRAHYQKFAIIVETSVASEL